MCGRGGYVLGRSVRDGNTLDWLRQVGWLLASVTFLNKSGINVHGLKLVVLHVRLHTV